MSSDSIPQKGSAKRGSAVENENGVLVSSNYVQSIEKEIPDVSFVGIDLGLDKSEEEDDNLSPVEKASPRLYVDEQLNSKRYEIIKPDTLPSDIPCSTETFSRKIEILEALSESSTKEVANEGDNVESKGENPPPLAGANVMNVILVAAECAPFVKTGN